MVDRTKSQEILARYNAGERDFRKVTLDDSLYDFSEMDMSGAIFAGSAFVASFKNAKLEDADFSCCNVKTCDFSGARLRGATFQGSSIDAADFRGSDLFGTNFEGASEQGYIYTKGELPSC